MEDLIFDIGSKRPQFVEWIFDYLNVWYHDDFNEEANGELRFVGPPFPMHCGFFPELLKSTALFLNVFVNVFELSQRI